MNLEWVSNHWSILGIVFVSGGLWAANESQIQTVEDVVVKQSEIIDELTWGKETLIRQDEQIKAIQVKQNDISGKIDFLIEIQLRGMESGQPRPD